MASTIIARKWSGLDSESADPGWVTDEEPILESRLPDMRLKQGA